MTNWGCPHLGMGQCGLLDKDCCPTQRGCVLEGKVKLHPKPVLQIAGLEVLAESSKRSQSKQKRGGK